MIQQNRSLFISLLAALLFLGFTHRAFSQEPPVVESFQFPLIGGWTPIFDFNNWSSGYCGRHLGQDIQRSPETPVFPIAAGIVKFAKHLGKGSGYVVILEHKLLPGTPAGEYITSVYYHMRRPESKEKLTENDLVFPDQVIGYVSGNRPDHANTVPHLHFGIRKGRFISSCDPRTKKWYYPGYTAIHSAGVNRECAPRGSKPSECNSQNPIHNQIASFEWLKPSDFIGSVNRLPDQPEDLTQYKADGMTGLPLGGTTSENSVVMTGKVSDPDGDTLQLEVEARKVGISFLDVPNCTAGDITVSGGVADATCSGLVDGSYHWQARAKSAKGFGRWKSAGGNLENQADFIVQLGVLSPTLSIDGGISSTRQQLQTFSFTGANYTPNQPVTRYLRQPDGSEVVLTPTLSANATGGVSWTFTPTCSTPTGTYRVRVKDNATGVFSNWVDEIITASPSCSSPILRIDGSTSSTRPQLETFSFSGSSYTPNQIVTRYLQQPDGSTVTLSPTLSADSAGNISWTFTSVCTTPTGAYTVWARDDATGRTSNTVTETITASASCAPTLRIDGGLSSTRPQGQTFSFTGTNYTPNRTVTRYLRLPSGSTITLTPTLSADGGGNLSWTFTPSCSSPLGTYTAWAIDDATGRRSNDVTEIITQGPGC